MKVFVKCAVYWFLIFSSFLHAQQRKIDSLLTRVKTMEADTNRVSELNALSWEYCSIAEYEKGLQYGKEALSLGEKLQFKKGIATSYNNIAFICHKQGNYTRALENNLRALKMREEIGDKAGIATSQNNLGLVYERQNNYPWALAYHQASLKIKLELGNKKPIAASYNNTGNVYYALGNFPKALENYTASLLLKQELGDKKGMASCYNNIGAIYQREGNTAEALKNYLASLEIKEQLQDKYGVAVACNNIGGLYLSQNKITEAKQRQLKALAIANEIGANDVRMIVYNSLSLCDSAAGNFRGAYSYYKQYKQYSDTLFNEENSKKNAEMAALYESEKKDKKISVLNIENESRNKQRKQLFFIIGLILIFLIVLICFYVRKRKDNSILVRQKKEIIEKTELLKFQAQEIAKHQSQMNPHFIFNALNTLQGTILNEQTDESLEQLKTLSKLMRMTLNNSEKEWISIADETDYLQQYVDFEVKRFPVKVAFTIRVGEGLDVENTGIPPMLLQPIVENSIKHANLDKKTGSEIAISFVRKGKHLVIAISDNGSGRKHNSVPSHISKSLSITQSRVAELNVKANAIIENAFTIFDLENEGTIPAGTRTQLIIPYYELF